MRASNILPIIALISLMTFSSCGNNSIKDDKAKIDSIKAEKDWDKTIIGNFSSQKTIQFDSLMIDSFLNTYPELAFLDSNLNKFYHNRNFHYAWFDQQGLIEQAGNLVARVSNMTDEGLFKNPPYTRELDSLLLEARMVKQDSQPHTVLELMLTAQYFNFAKIAWQGADQRISESLQWYLPRKKISYDEFLDSLLDSNSEQIKNIKEPVYRQYELLKVFLTKFRKLDNDVNIWPEIISDKLSYKVGDSSLIISQIKKRLFLLDEFKGDTSFMLFDQELFNTIKGYQSRLGLAADGI